MILDLKKIFLNENASLSTTAEIDLKNDSTGDCVLPDILKADVSVRNRAGVVEFTAQTEFVYRCRCDRCGEFAEKKLAYRFEHILVAAPVDGDSDDYIEAPDYMLDTDALLRDDILLELPSKFLCKDSCKGLCPKCGKNLNVGRCGCPEKEIDPRLAVLSKLLEE